MLNIVLIFQITLNINFLIIKHSSKLLGGEVPGGVPEGGLPDYV